MLTLLADADIFAYKVACTHEELHEWEPGNFNLVSNGQDAVKALDEMIERLMNHLKADNIVMVLSDTDNFRKKILNTYKANRIGVAKPLCLKFVKDYITNNYETKQKPGLEGDDVIGILATHPKLIPGDKVIVSIDKDFGTVPARWYNPDEDTIRDVSKNDADYFHLVQTLTGDTCDNYKGCPGIGLKRAEAILAEANGDKSKAWSLIVSAYEKKGLTEADALVQARCARILRAEDYDFKKKGPILWNPIK